MNTDNRTPIPSVPGKEPQALDAELDQSSNSVLEQASESAQIQDAALLSLHRLLRMPSVAVPDGFADAVMARVQTADRHAVVELSRSKLGASSWAAAVLGAVALASLVFWLAPSESGGSVFGTFVAAVSVASLAGAGMLSASWQGVGSTVGSWLGTSPTVGASLALGFVGFVAIGALGLRRARQRSR